MKAVCKKLFSLMLVAILLVSAVPFQVSAEETVEPDATEAASEPAAIETTEAAVEPAADVENEVTTPAVDAAVPFTKEVVHVHFQLDSSAGLVTENYQVGSIAKSKLGSKVNTPAGSTALNVLAQAIGSSAGYEFVRWEYEAASGRKTFTNSVVLNKDNMIFEDGWDEVKEEEIYILNVYAVIKEAPKTITLSANGGSVANTKHQVEIGQQYDFYGALPTPTRNNYTFAGWFKDDGTQVANDSIVTDLSKLTAKWNGNKYNVEFRNYEGTAAYTIDPVEANSVLKTAYNNFPTTAQIDEYFAAPAEDGWTIDGWEVSFDNEKTWNTFTAGSTKIAGNAIIRPLYKKSITLYACDSGNTTRKLTVTLNKRYPTLPHPGTRDGYAFLGWYTDAECGGTEISSKANLSNVAKHPYVEYDVGALYAGWDQAKTVYLYIHTGGNTKEHTKLVRYYDVPATGFSLTDINLGDIFPNYGKYDDSVDEKYGWYDNAQWKNYCLNKHVNDTTEYVTAEYLDTDDVHEFYIMLIDNGANANAGSANGTGYNDNKTTVDKSNPSTGDDIFVAVTVMAVSACALLLFFMNKKRFAK